MKKVPFFAFTLLTLTLFCNRIHATNFNADENVIISDSRDSDQYLAGKKVTINAFVDGDVIAGAETLTVNDTVTGDLLVGGGYIFLNSYIGDDVRIAGGEIELNGVVEGDFIVFAGQVTIGQNAEIRGDLIVYSGEVTLAGHVYGSMLSGAGKIMVTGQVDGNADMKAGEIQISGSIGGNLKASATEFYVEPTARCEGSVEYWSAQGESDLSSFSESVRFNEDLAMVEEEMDWKGLVTLFGLGIISYWVIFILSTFVVLLLLEHFLGHQFERAASVLSSKFVLSFGYGMLYFIGIPVLSVLLFVIIIGFPIGVLTLSIYLLTLLFTASITGLAVAHYFKLKYGKNWTYFQTVGYALLTVVVLKVIFWIPILGWLMKRLLAAAVYGAFILLLVKGKSLLQSHES
ncbi:MAG: polymer-forming cytoskeletal protein [Vicingaceae bacterium]